MGEERGSFTSWILKRERERERFRPRELEREVWIWEAPPGVVALMNNDGQRQGIGPMREEKRGWGRERMFKGNWV